MALQNQQPKSLEDLLDRIEAASKKDDDVSLGEILDAVGHRSFGPIILLAGIITVMPLVGDIPGVPVVMGAVVGLTAVQILFRHEHVWLPEWLLERSVDSKKLRKASGWMRKPARFMDRLAKSRLHALVSSVSVKVIAVACVVIAVATPAMEFVPFSATFAGAALTGFGLALITRDGLLALIALAFTVGTFGFLVYSLLG